MRITYFISKNTKRLIHISERTNTRELIFLLFDKAAYKLKRNNFDSLVKTLKEY